MEGSQAGMDGHLYETIAVCPITEQKGDTFAVVRPADTLRDRRRHVDDDEFFHTITVLILGNGVGNLVRGKKIRRAKQFLLKEV